MTEVRTGDIVRHRSPYDGFIRIGIVRRVALRAEGLLAEICAPGAGFGTVVELIERPSDHAVVAKPNGRVPMIGEMVAYEMHEGAGRHTGSVFGVLLLCEAPPWCALEDLMLHCAKSSNLLRR